MSSSLNNVIIIGGLLVLGSFLYSKKMPPFDEGGLFDQIMGNAKKGKSGKNNNNDQQQMASILPVGNTPDFSMNMGYPEFPNMVDLGMNRYIPNPSPNYDQPGYNNASNPTPSNYKVYNDYLTGIRAEQALQNEKDKQFFSQQQQIGGDITTLPQPYGAPTNPAMMGSMGLNPYTPIAPPAFLGGQPPMFPYRPPPPPYPRYPPYQYPYTQQQQQNNNGGISIGPDGVRVGGISIGPGGINIPGLVNIGGGLSNSIDNLDFSRSNSLSSGGLFGGSSGGISDMIRNMMGGIFGNFRSNRASANDATFIEYMQNSRVPTVPQDVNGIHPTLMNIVSRNQPMGLMSNKLGNVV